MKKRIAAKNCRESALLHEIENSSSLRLRRLGIDTYQEAVIYMPEDCLVCRSEGFEAQSRILVEHGSHSIIATLNVVKNGLLEPGEAGLSEAAWQMLDAEEGSPVTLSHPPAIESLGKVRAKIFGKHLSETDYRQIVGDIVKGNYSDVHLSAFIAACAGERMEQDEIISLTKGMIESGKKISWGRSRIMDKHCVGGLPGNRTTLLIVPIIASFGLTIPKTSSRAITSPAGTADTMEVLAPVNLELRKMRQIVESEGGCIAWGGAVKLSPADDILIRVERALDIDSEGQMIASVLSKKVAAGSTHVVIDIPVGTTAKVRNFEAAQKLSKQLKTVGKAIGLTVQTIISDGSQPVGRGIGPALEARDVISVLNNEKDAPDDLRERALILAGSLLEMSGAVAAGKGRKTAQMILENGDALRKFIAICEAQGGFRELTDTSLQQPVISSKAGIVTSIDNRNLARVAKLAGAPRAKLAGVDFHTSLGSQIEIGQPLYTVHAETAGELDYALGYVNSNGTAIQIEEV